MSRLRLQAYSPATTIASYLLLLHPSPKLAKRDLLFDLQRDITPIYSPDCPRSPD